MKRRRRLQPSDSLDLLLDTMCNSFGGIIFIAILVALLVRENPLPIFTQAQQATEAMAERRLALAEADLAAARELCEQLKAKAPASLVATVEAKKTVEQSIENLETENLLLAAQVEANAEDRVADPAKELKPLLEEYRRNAREAIALQNTLQAQEQNRVRLQTRLAEISASLRQREAKVETVHLRFPKERSKLTGSIPVIFRYGKTYPLYTERGDKNDQTIDWKKLPDRDQTTPIEARGWTMATHRGEIDRWLRDSPRSEGYLAFFVYPDSVAEFRAFREAAVAQGWEFGIELVQPGAKLYWGNEGKNPPPL